MPSEGSKFSTTANNLEYLALDLSLELGIKLVSVGKRILLVSQPFFAHLSTMLVFYLLSRKVRNLSNPPHFFQVLAGVVRVDHFVGRSDIIAAKNLNAVASWMVEIGNVVDNSINANFVVGKCLHGSHHLLSRLSCIGGQVVSLHGIVLSLAELISVGSHGFFFLLDFN